MKYIAIYLMLIFSAALKGDIPYYFSYKLYYKGEIIYIKTTHNPNNTKDTKNYGQIAPGNPLFDFIKTKDSVRVYKTLEKVDITNVPGFENENQCFIFKDPFLIAKTELISNSKIIFIEVAHNSGFEFSKELNSKDNFWLNRNKIEKILDYNDGELCSFSLYSIKDSFSKGKIEKLKNEIKSCFNEIGLIINSKKLNNIISTLYARKVIKLGYCSC